MISLLEKEQNIPKHTIDGLCLFTDALEKKDIVSFGLCYVDRAGEIYSLHFEAAKNYALTAAVDYLSVKVKGGL